jgi:uncharacterized phage-associated protein
MPYIKLMKLMYFADREMLLRWGLPMTYDRWCAMKCGPVLSATYNLMKKDDGDTWHKYIAVQGYDIALKEDPGSDELSPAETEIIEEIFERQGKKDKWTLVETSHCLPEWEDPIVNTSHPITYRSVLEGEGFPLPEIEKILETIEAEEALDRILSKAG